MAFNPDLGAHIMECGNTAALQEKTMNDRDMTAAEEAELNDRAMELAKKIAAEEFFATDVISEIEESWFQAVAELSIGLEKDLPFATAVGQKIVRTIRDRAIAAARKELGA